MVDGVIFDMDGLMFDTEPLWTKAWYSVLPRFDIPEVPAALPDACRGTAGEVTYAIMRKYLGETIDAPAIWAEMKSEVHRMLELGVTKKPGLDELLAFLAERNTPMAVASSSPLATIKMDLANAQVSEYFTYLVSGEDVDRPKPDPLVFILSAERMGTAPERTLVLEDSYNGVRAGAAGGFITVMVPDMIAPDDEMQRLCTRICADLSEVCVLLKNEEL